MNQKTIDKRISNDQDYTTQHSGTNKKWCDTEYRFHGQDWENFAILLANRSRDQHVLNFFIGAHMQYHMQTVTLCNAFGFEVWLDKHARYFPKWNFKLDPKRIRLPRASKDDDSLRYMVNGKNSSELWEDHYIPPQNERVDDAA